MKVLLKKRSVLLLLTMLLFVVGVAHSDNTVFPTVTTNWPVIFGASGTKQVASNAYKVGANDYDFMGQSVSGSFRAGALFSLVPSTSTTTPVVFNDGTSFHFDMGTGVLPLASGNYLYVGTKIISGTESHGSVFVRSNAGGAVAGVHTFGSGVSLTRFNKAVQISGGTYDGKVALVGFTTQSGTAGAGDAYYARITAGATITADAVAYVGGTTSEEEAFGLVQTSTTELLLVGRQKSGTNYNFFFKKFLMANGTVVSAFAPAIAGTGTDDCIRDVLIDGDGNIVVVGTSGTGTGRVGYVAKLDPTTGALVTGYEFTTSATDVELYDAALLSDGSILVTGRSGNDLYLAKIMDNGSSYVMDWGHAYDSGRTGDIGYFCKEEADSTILVCGVANDAGSSTDAVFWHFEVPAAQAGAGPSAFNQLYPADAATAVIPTDTLTWEASTDAELGFAVEYELTWGTASDFTGATVVPNLTTESYAFSTGDLTHGTTYYWKVRALDANNGVTASTQSPNGWSFTTSEPSAFNLLLPADAATDQSLTPTLSWEASTETGFTISYTLTYANNSSFTGATTVDSIATNSYTFTAGDLDHGTTYYWKVTADDGDGATVPCTQDPNGWSFTTSEPSAFNLLSPADAATDQSLTVTLNWEASTETGYTISYTLTYATNSSFTGATTVDSIATNSYTFSTGDLSNDNTYYWKVTADNGDGVTLPCVQDPNGWSFSTPVSPPGALSVGISANIGATPTYYDNNNIAGFDPLAANGFDAYDVPEPPVLGNNFCQAFVREPGFTSAFQQKLQQDIRSTVSKNFTTTGYMFLFRVVTDQTGTVNLAFDATTNNSGSRPVVLWDGTAFQNVLGSDNDATYTYASTGTTGSAQTDNFALLIGDETGPALTHNLPLPDSTTEISRSSTTTLSVTPDNSSPIRRVRIYFSPADDSNAPRQNFTELTNSPALPSSVDDPTDGINNGNVTFDWNPILDDAAIFTNPTDVFPDAQLRFVAEDWAGNTTTSDVNFAIVPDAFSYTGDYGAGFHLISVPLTPDNNTPTTMFTTSTGNDSGVAGGYSMFQYSVGTGYTTPATIVNGKGYWLVLDQDNTTAASNSGLGTVLGTLPDPTAYVSLTLDHASANLVGVAVRNDDLGGNHLQADDWEFSTDGSTWYPWTDATTTNDKGGDATIWIDPTSLVGFDNTADDFTTSIADNANLTPGLGYLLVAGTPSSGALQMRVSRTSAAVDVANPNNNNNNNNNGSISATDEFTGEWAIPIHMALGSFSNNLSSFGCRTGATAGWDNGIDVSAPPLPPSGNYVRAVVDGQSWGSPFARYFVGDIRAPFAGSANSASWDYRVNASENGTVSMTFDLSQLPNYQVPDNFRVIATVNGNTFDIRQNNVITFNYTGTVVIVHLEAYLDATGANEPINVVPTTLEITKAYPNPFNPETTVRIGVPTNTKLRVAVYNTLGEVVAVLANGTYNAGYHNFSFNGSKLASGTYIIRAMANGQKDQIMRVTLVR